MNSLRLGTRASALALWQTGWIRMLLQVANPSLKIEVIRISTRGDLDQRTPLARSSERGVFVKALEDALLDERIDVAVHSMKDVPTQLPEGLEIAAVARRGDPREALITPGRTTLVDLPHGATLATGSPRRRAQLAHFRPDLKFVEVRGNLDTRLKKLAKSGWDGLVVAYAGVKRLVFEKRVVEVLPVEVVLPAAGQAAIGLEIRADDRQAREIVQGANHTASMLAVKAERAFLRGVGGGCATPVATYAVVEGNRLHISGLVAAPDGGELIQESLSGDPEDPESLGLHLAERVLVCGARALVSWDLA